MTQCAQSAMGTAKNSQDEIGHLNHVPGSIKGILM